MLMTLSLIGGAGVCAQEPRTIGLPSGLGMQVLSYPAGSETLLLWIPSKYGIRPGNRPFAETVRDAGIDYWLIDLHGSYGVPAGRYSYPTFQPADIKALIDHALALGWRRVFLGGESRGAALAMKAARQWQEANPGDARLKGMLFYHPYLIEGKTPIGKSARFHPIARATNLPMYIFQPELNTKHLHSLALVEQLERGGAPVYLHSMAGVRGGFHVREANRLNRRETAERARIGRRIKTAMALLLHHRPPRRAAPAQGDAAPAPGTAAAAERGPLTSIGRRAPFSLRLHDADGRVIELGDYPGQVLLLNFWATWCGPCVEEIDSLTRLAARFENRAFRVVTANLSEDTDQVNAFLDELGVRRNFDVLFDRDGSTAKAWRIYAVPSTYLLDRRHQVRMGYRGALNWDRPDVVEAVQALLDEP